MIVFAALTPHPPILIPEVGKGEEKKIIKTSSAMQKLAEELNAAEPDVLLFITPHTLLYPDRFNICGMANLSGSFASFDAPECQFNDQNDLALAKEIYQAVEDSNITSAVLYDNNEPVFELDHGVLVPLYFFRQDLENPYRVLPIGYSYLSRVEHYEFGQIIGEVCAKSSKRIAIIASGDMSHRLFYNTPAGPSKRGQEFDRTFINLLGTDNEADIMNIDEALLEEAGECAYRSVLVALGALSHITHKPEVYSYEGPFGVGYLVANFNVKE